MNMRLQIQDRFANEKNYNSTAGKKPNTRLKRMEKR